MANVMICEDDPLIAIDTADSVRLNGHTVCGVFASAFEALAALAKSKADIVIVDLQLKDGNTGAGVAVAAANAGLKVIVFSGHCGVSIQLSQVPHVFVQKPVPRSIFRDLASVWSPV